MDTNEDNVIDAEIVEERRSLPVRYRVDPSNYETLEPSARREAELEANAQRRCTAHSSRTGERCRKWAVLGTEPGICATHGASTPQVKRAARKRLEEAADRMAAHLLGLAENATSEAIQLGATNSALDRAGLKAPSEVVLSQSDPKPYEQIFERIATTTRADSRAMRGLPETDCEPLGYEVSAGKPNAAGYRETSGYRFQAEAGGRESADTPLSPASAFAADTTPGDNAPPRWPNAPAQPGTRPARDRQAGNQGATRHIQGDDALAVAAQLARQKAIESGGYVKYRAHRRQP